ncbi:S66 peptidase family protein [Kaistella palustris]|uniref:S66 peptidase family protein n=1 Tax=Kaistella palustris TaxID=493376 RepID=UPI0003F5C635|nr:LD-carboxypeptidase [Kaistella palustris]
MQTLTFPGSLQKGDKIAVISPAGSVNEQQLTDGLNLIEMQGYEPVLGKHVYTEFKNGYSYAGTEKERIQDLNWAFNDADIKAVWASRGGYGCQHLLGHIQLSAFRKNPKWFIGYSDNTVIQSFLFKNHFPSIHAQSIKTASFGVSAESYTQVFDILKGKFPKYKVEKNLHNKAGNVEGLLIGGNLALVYALLGTRYSFNFKDKILFIEEVGEQYYSLDRMLMSLELAGAFRQIKGLIIGGMTNMGDEKQNKNYETSFDEFAYQLISERLKKYDFPTLFGFPNGHIYENRPLIIGGNARLNVGKLNTVEF